MRAPTMFYWLLIHIHTSYPTFGCHRNCYTFVDRTVWADDTVLAQAQLQHKYYGKSMNWSRKIVTTNAFWHQHFSGCRALFVHSTVEWHKWEHHASLFCHWRVSSHHKHLSPQEWWSDCLCCQWIYTASQHSRPTPNISHYGLYVCLVEFSCFPLQQIVVLERRGKNISVWILNVDLNISYLMGH